jgi:HK97 family phage major capsid protein
MDANLMELIEKRKSALEKANALNELTITENRNMTEDEVVRYDGYMKEADMVDGQIKRAEDLKAKSLDTEERSANYRTPVTSTEPVSGGKDLAEDKPWESTGTFLRAVADASSPHGHVDPRLLQGMTSIEARNAKNGQFRAASGANEGVNADGGFLVKTDQASGLLQREHVTGQLAAQTSHLPISTNANSITVPTVDETSRTTGNRYGGIRVYTANEAATVTATKARFGELRFDLNKYMGITYITEELMQDAGALEAWVMDKFPEEIRYRIDEDIIRGNGAGQLLGILNSGSLVSQAAENNQPAATVVTENIVNMYSRMDPRGLANAKWYINSELFPQIYTLTLAVGTGGSSMFVEAGKLPDTPNGSLLGKPIEIIEQCSALGTVGDIIFADMSQYMRADKGGIKQATSMHVRFLYDEMAYRFTYRVDGKPMFDSALTPAYGSATQSPFVALATR